MHLQGLQVALWWLLHTLGVAVSQYCRPTAPRCFASTVFAHIAANQSSSNYFYIAGLFGVHEKGTNLYTCGNVRERGIQNLEAFLWRIKDFRKRFSPSILDGINVGAIAFDSCSSVDRTMQQMLNLENCAVGYGQPPIQPSRIFGYVGPDRSQEAMSVATALGQMGKAQVVSAATSVFLNDSQKYPYLIRAVPSDAEQVVPMINVIQRLKWKYVQLVYSDNVYGRTGAATFKTKASENQICIVQEVKIPVQADASRMSSIVGTLLQQQKTRGVVVFANDNYARMLLQATKSMNARGVFTWIASNSWGKSKDVIKGLESVAEGVVTVTLDDLYRGVDDFKMYFRNLKPVANKKGQLNPWFDDYWEKKFNCYLSGRPKGNYQVQCDIQSQSLKDFSLDTYVPATIKAVDSILDGVHNAQAKECRLATSEFCPKFLSSTTKFAKIRDAIINTKINDVRYDSATKIITTTRHSVVNLRSSNANCQSNCYNYVQVGTYQSSMRQTQFSDELFVYDKKGSKVDNPTSTCSGSCPACGVTTTEATTSTPAVASTAASRDSNPYRIRDDKWIIALMVLGGLGILIVIIFEIYLMSKIIGTPFVKHWRTMWLGQLLLLAVLLCYLTLFAFVPVPSVTTCAIIRFGVGCSYAMCFAVLLVKLMIILSSKSVGYLKGIYQVLMFVFAWGVQIVVDVEWLILVPPRTRLEVVGGIERTMCEHTFIAHIQSLVYVMFLILMTTILAMKTHGIITNHREGIFIGMTAGFAIPIWICWILLGHFNSHLYYQDPCLAFGLFITATLILFIMFLPKVRQLNSMGVEGIYAEDDPPAGEVYANSVVQGSMVPGSVLAGSIVYGPPSHKSKTGPGSVVYVNGGVYSAGGQGAKTAHLHVEADPNALYLKHPGKLNPASSAASVRSAPIMYGTAPREPDSAYASTKVLRVTNDLTGKANIYPTDRRALSEYNYVNGYGTARSLRSSKGSGTLKKPRSLQDLGSL